MPRLCQRSIVLRGAVCLTAPLLLTLPARAGSPETLTPGVGVERFLAAGAASVFDAELEVGKPWRVRVEQLGIDVVVEAKDLLGGSLLTVGSPLGREGTESLLLTPARTGTYRFEVRCEEKGVPAGRYVLRLDELPEATDEDRMRLRAEKALSDAGQLYAGEEEGSREKALTKLREALEAWSDLGDRREEARTLLLAGSYLDALNDDRQAAASYEQALALSRELGDPGGVAAALDRLGLAQVSLGEIPRAVAILEEALVLRQRLGSSEREAQTLNLLGFALQKSGRFRDAAGRYEESLARAREIGDTELEARLLNNLGGIFQNLGEPARELQYLQQALELQRAIGSAFGEAAALNNLGPYYRRLGDVETALHHYSQALAIFERLGERRWQARTLNNIGFAYLTVGELERARAFFLRALPLWREAGDKANETVTLLNLGRTFHGLGETGRALAYFKKALELSLAAGNRRYATSARQRLGEFYLDEGDPSSAKTELELVLTSLRESGQRSQQAETLELLSRVALALGDLPKAETLATEALGLYRAVRHPGGEAAVLATLARVRRAEKRFDTAREHLEAALRTLETLHGYLGDPSQRASFLATQREVYELYVDVLMQLHLRSPGEGYDLAALAGSERSHSRSLLAVLEGVGAGLEREVEPALRERLRAAEQRFGAKVRRQLAVLDRRHGTEEELLAEQELYAALNDLDEVRAELRRKSPRYASLSRAETLDAPAIRGLLDDETVLLEYLLGGERSYLFWVTRSAVATYVLPPRRKIEALAVRLHEQLSGVHQRTETAREGLRDLGEMLLGPITEQLRDERLAVVADGALHFVPFAALTVPGSGGAPLLARHEVVYLPSASVLASQRKLDAPVTSTKTVAVLADPIFDRQDPRLAASAAPPGTDSEALRSGLTGLSRLTYTRQEAAAIAALVPPGQRLVALDGAARRSRVVDGELASYRILHFATHGLVDSRTPELSGLMLSRLDGDGRALDGFLGLYDISNLGISAELVVLSGCRTALGKQVRGEGLVGLTRGFMVAGARRVVASFWQVRDQATTELMARFYHAMLTEKLRAPAALRAAQLELREQRRFRDPFYWAAFALYGDWR